MTQTLEAIFENGVFRPLEEPAVPIRDGQHVRIIVEADTESVDILLLASQVYDGLDPEEIDRIEELALDRTHCFDNRS